MPGVTPTQGRHPVKPCSRKECAKPARWRIVGKPVITCDDDLARALDMWPGARAVPLPEDPHEPSE